MKPARSYNRDNATLRTLKLTPGASRHAEGSCLIECGNTKVLCTASVEEQVPPFLRNTGKGWVTAEYGMLPRSTGSRNPREAAKGKQSGRTQEIQRLIGRSLRAAVDMTKLGERQIIIDCDVLEADGGTRTASVTGGYVALAMAMRTLVEDGLLKHNPLKTEIAAISAGICKGAALLDLDYLEDSSAEVDANFVFNGNLELIEVQGTAENAAFKTDQFIELLKIAEAGARTLIEAQKDALKSL
ncbi:MAG: ribonuclease PH [Rickettsiales bacterium]